MYERTQQSYMLSEYSPKFYTIIEWSQSLTPSNPPQIYRISRSGSPLKKAHSFKWVYFYY